MNLFSAAKKFVKTFSFKQKQKLLNSLLYQGDDMLEDPEVYQSVFDIIKNEEKQGEHNSNTSSMVNLIMKYARDANGSVNYVFKVICLLVK